MRYAILGLGMGGLLLAAGCSGIQPRGTGGGGAAAVRPPDFRQPTATAMVAYLNENARRAQAVTCRDLSLECRQGSDSGIISGRLDCQRPRNFRLTGKVVGQPQVDIGSNDSEFWFWIGKAPQPYVYHCSYDALARGGVRLPFPSQPELILSALGMAEYDPTGKYEVRNNGRTVELIEPTVSPQGQPMKKVTVFNARPTGRDQPVVLAYLLRDANDRQVCAATVEGVKTDPATGAVLPRRMRIVCAGATPRQSFEMRMRMDSIQVTSIDAQLASSLFSRRNLKSQRSYDLDRGQPDDPSGTSEVRPVGVPPH